MFARVLLALRSNNARRQIKRFLASSDIVVESTASGDKVWKRIYRETCDLVVVDLELFSDPPGKTIAKYKEQQGAASLVVLIGQEEPEERAQLMEAGCDAVLFSGLPASELAAVFKTMLDKHIELRRESLAYRHVIQEPRLDDFVSKSPIMSDFMNLVGKVVGSNTSLLILGETGVGKERLARAIHRARGRDGAFVAVNCGALPESLMESELFGHEEGAFTGANRARRGCFELAHLGTIFLDEIGEMPVHLQVRLLRVLQEREVQRVGAEWPTKVDVRVMAATSRDMDELVREGKFRSDLLYRLQVVSLEVPPLRERREDITELVQSYIHHFAEELGRDVQTISSEAMGALEQHDWPGNVREMINVIERATLLCSGREIELVDLPLSVRQAIAPIEAEQQLTAAPEGALPLPPAWRQRPLKEVREVLVEQLERAYLTVQLEATKGRIAETAQRAGITPRALFDKMQRYGLRKEDFRFTKKQ